MGSKPRAFLTPSLRRIECPHPCTTCGMTAPYSWEPLSLSFQPKPSKGASISCSPNGGSEPSIQTPGSASLVFGGHLHTTASAQVAPENARSEHRAVVVLLAPRARRRPTTP